MVLCLAQMLACQVHVSPRATEEKIVLIRKSGCAHPGHKHNTDQPIQRHAEKRGQAGKKLNRSHEALLVLEWKVWQRHTPCTVPPVASTCKSQTNRSWPASARGMSLHKSGYVQHRHAVSAATEASFGERAAPLHVRRHTAAISSQQR